MLCLPETKVIKFAATGANILADSTALIPSLWNDMKDQYQQNKNKTYSSAKEKNDWKLFMLDYLQPKIKWEQLQTISCPALIIAGDKDLIAPTHTLSIFQNIPRAQLWIMPNCGHATMQDYPTEFNNKVQQFFKHILHHILSIGCVLNQSPGEIQHLLPER